MSTLPTLRELFDAWFFYLTNEGVSATPIGKWTAITTGVGAALALFLPVWIIQHRSDLLDLIATAFLAAGMVLGVALARAWRLVWRR